MKIPEVARLLNKPEKTIRYWIRHGKLPARLVNGQYEIDAADLPVIPEEAPGIETIIARLEELERRVSELEAQLAHQAPTPAPRILKPPAPTSEITASGTLPEGWIPLADLMKQSPTPSRSTVFRQMKDFIQTGHWIVNGHEVTNALDSEGQAEFRRRYAPREYPMG